ncbi:ABC transporter substrate-binding protein [Bradyrhizobium sp. WSM2254]|uniref:ABC transporter substrate-binding protein n=1 Tax=Bradyrhizobium sp. WSM2254 TaxID=1188263 RepID=UPI00041176F4|nr:ABC transporter substrate-binding protein [Bradyrhizobium sp. WSM2254]
MKRNHLLMSVIATALTFATASFARASDEAGTKSEIKLGQTQPYSGPVSAASAVGYAMSGYVEYINRRGGINGRKVVLISLDDAYSPPKTVEMTRKLVEGDEVIATVGSLGTPTNAAVQKYLNARKVPQLFVVSGGKRFFDPKGSPWTIPLLPSYEAEGRAMGRYAASAVTDPKIAIIYQNDDLGRDFVAGFKEGLGAKKSAIISEQSFELSAPTIQTQMVTAKASGANVLYFAGTQKYGAMHIRIRYELDWKPVHLIASTSAGVESVIKPAGFQQSEGVISTAYSKDPFDERWKDDPETKAYLAWFKEYLPSRNLDDTSHLVGYYAGYLTEYILKKAGSDLSGENLLRIASNLDKVRVPMLLPGVTVSTAPANYNVIDKFQMQRFASGHWVPFGELVGSD